MWVTETVEWNIMSERCATVISNGCLSFVAGELHGSALA